MDYGPSTMDSKLTNRAPPRLVEAGAGPGALSALG